MPLTEKEVDTLVGIIRGLMDGAAVKAHSIDPIGPGAKTTYFDPFASKDPPVITHAPRPTDDVEGFEKLYQAIKARFIDEARIDPILLRLLTDAPAIVVEVEPRIVTIDGSSTRGRVARLMASGWFKNWRKVGAVRQELKRTGADPGGGGALYDVIANFKRDGFLTESAEGFALASGVTVTEKTIVAS